MSVAMGNPRFPRERLRDGFLFLKVRWNIYIFTIYSNPKVLNLHIVHLHILQIPSRSLSLSLSFLLSLLSSLFFLVSYLLSLLSSLSLSFSPSLSLSPKFIFLKRGVVPTRTTTKCNPFTRNEGGESKPRWKNCCVKGSLCTRCSV